MTDKYVSVPVELTAENGAKAALMGEFFERLEMGCADCSGGVVEGDLCESCEGAGELIYKVPVSWSTIKAIWKKSIEAVAAPEPASAEPVVMPYLLRKGGMWYAHNSSGKMSDQYRDLPGLVRRLVDDYLSAAKEAERLRSEVAELKAERDRLLSAGGYLSNLARSLIGSEGLILDAATCGLAKNYYNTWKNALGGEEPKS